MNINVIRNDAWIPACSGERVVRLGLPSATPSIAFDPANLCKRIFQSDPLAETELVERYLRRVCTLVAVRTNDFEATEDLGQDIMLAAICALRRALPQDPEMLSAFIFGIARNLLNSDIRRRIRQRSDLHPTTKSISHQAFTRQRGLLEDARREIENLDGMHREVLELTFNAGMEPAEIAVSLNLPAATVRRRKSRALQRLVERLDPLAPAKRRAPAS